MSTPTIFLNEMGREKADYRITAKLVDALGAPIPAGSLAALTLTLYAVDATQPIINNVDHVNILNTGRGTVDVNGNLTITLGPNDMVLVDASAPEELHNALVEFTYNGGNSSGRKNLRFRVYNFEKVT